MAAPMTSLPTGTIRSAPKARNLRVSRRKSQADSSTIRWFSAPAERARASARRTSPMFQSENASRTSSPSARRKRPSTASLPSSARYRLTRALESKYTVVTGIAVLPDQRGHWPTRVGPPILNLVDRREALAAARPGRGHGLDDGRWNRVGYELLNPRARGAGPVVAEDLIPEPAPHLSVEQEHRLVLLRHLCMVYHITI